MSPGIDQLGADRAHGAIVGGESLVELSHVSADGGLAFHEVDAKALLGQVEAGLHSGNAAAEDEDGTGDRISKAFGNHWVTLSRAWPTIRSNSLGATGFCR